MVYYTKTDLVSFLIGLLSLVINSIGLFINQWWETTKGARLGLFTTVSCTDDICAIHTETSAWIIVAQVTSLVQFFGLIAALSTHVLNCCEVSSRNKLRFLTLVLFGASCLFAHLHTFILISAYGRLTRAYYEHRPLPADYVYFLTLPVGLNAISGVMALGPFLALVVVHTREKRMSQKSTISGKGIARSDSKTHKVTAV